MAYVDLRGVFCWTNSLIENISWISIDINAKTTLQSFKRRDIHKYVKNKIEITI